MKRIWMVAAIAAGGLVVGAPGIAVSHADTAARCTPGANCTGTAKAGNGTARASVPYQTGEDPLVPEGGDPFVILPPGYSLAF